MPSAIFPIRTFLSARPSCRFLLASKVRPACFHHHRHRPLSTRSTRSTRSMSPIPYEPIEDVERMHYYDKGGYHPVKIGDKFHDRYNVVHKLGHGTYSTIWLARDERVKRYVALKICTGESDSREIDILFQLSERKDSGIGRTMIPPLLDTFTIAGPNGTHTCPVTTPARMSMSTAKNASWECLFQLDVSRALVAQLVMEVSHIHSQGFVHGDLHDGNILFHLKSNIDNLSTRELYDLHDELDHILVNRLDGQELPVGVPTHGIVPIWLGEKSEKLTLPEARIILTDFGETLAPSQEERYHSNTALSIRPPEVQFQPDTPLSFSADIWTLACTMFDIFSQRPLFTGFLTDDDDMTCQQIAALGPSPTEWWEKREGRSKHFDDDGKPNNRATSQYRSLESHFESDVQGSRVQAKMPTLEDGESAAFLDMVRNMLAFRPKERSSAREVLESEWMANRAVPHYKRMQRLQQNEE